MNDVRKLQNVLYGRRINLRELTFRDAPVKVIKVGGELPSSPTGVEGAPNKALGTALGR